LPGHGQKYPFTISVSIIAKKTKAALTESPPASGFEEIDCALLADQLVDTNRILSFSISTQWRIVTSNALSTSRPTPPGREFLR